MTLGIDDATIIARIQQAGILFVVTDDSLEVLKVAGASKAVLATVQKAQNATAFIGAGMIQTGGVGAGDGEGGGG